MPRKEHQFHYIYKTTCKVTGKFYVGMHSTSTLEDDYIGSGKILWYSINKHGRENHEKEILEFLPNRSSLKEREREIVNEEFLLDPMCMNLKIGGEGGWTKSGFISKEAAAAGGRASIKQNAILGSQKFQELLKDENFKESWIEKITASHLEKTGSKNGWKGRKHRPEVLQKMSEDRKQSQSGEKNSQFGTIWINDGKTSKKIRKTDSIPEGWSRGRKHCPMV